MDTTTDMLETLKTRFEIHGLPQLMLRRMVVAACLGLMLLLSWSIVADFRGPTVTAAKPIAPAEVRRRYYPQEDAASVGQEHLFGQANVAAAGHPVQTVSDISLSGILFSDHQDESRAIFIVGGQAVIVAPGGTLPDNELLLSIAEDRVTLDRNGTLVSVLLDIKKADTNSRIPMIALNGGASGSLADTGIAPMSAPNDAQQAGVSWKNQQGIGQGEITHGTFLPLSGIRGDPAKLGIMAPGAKPPRSRE